jgi:hypothetical protein
MKLVACHNIDYAIKSQHTLQRIKPTVVFTRRSPQPKHWQPGDRFICLSSEVTRYNPLVF